MIRSSRAFHQLIIIMCLPRTVSCWPNNLGVSVFVTLALASTFTTNHTKTLAFTPSTAFQRHALIQQQSRPQTRCYAEPITSTTTTTTADLQSSVTQLKKVLQREYQSFFDPMERDYYAPSVTFDDPLTQLEGVDGYQKNVDMLAGRTLLGSILFADAGIQLHSVTGGDIVTNKGDAGAVSIGDITTRWTLRFTFQALPWKPTARFTGISRYTCRAAGPKGVQITKQADYWDSINLVPGGNYQAVEKGVAVSHFIDQIKPGNLQAVAAGPELPYQLLRLGRDGYEVRRYPAYAAVQTRYERRDEAFSAMGAFTSGMTPMAPAIIQVAKERSDNDNESSSSTKSMQWPLNYALPGESVATSKTAVDKARGSNGEFAIVTRPETIVAVKRFGDAIVEPVVRRVDNELRDLLKRDGLEFDESPLTFAQYDAVFSMGKRRSEVQITLKEGGHPW